MYFPYFIAYIVSGLLIAGIVFCWALRNEQFKEQQRARFLPLEAADRRSAAPAATPWRRMEIYGLIVLACGGLSASAAVLIFALIKG